ncbi:MAG: cell division protein FtsA, partial [Treponema sp.]|nr:cell division protein FtsA [Treponema sp.]
MTDVIVGLDVGTSKICAVIGERNEKGGIEITGIGIRPSTGIKQGVVVNIDATIKSILDAIETAEDMCGYKIQRCWLGIGGGHVEGINSRGVVAITGQKRENREIGREDVIRVIEAARAIVVPLDRQIIQTIPQSYIVDDHRGIKDPLGMIGVRLEAEIHIITASVTSMKNLLRCVNRAGFESNKYLLLQALAAGRAVLTSEERECGVVLIDIGAGTTDVLVYYDGAPFSTFTVPLAGNDITKDISALKSIPFDEAERIKCEYGCCWETMLEDGDDDILIKDITGRSTVSIPRSHVFRITKPRMEEIFEMVREKLDGLFLNRPLSGGVVLTGGGAQLLGIEYLA